MSDVEQSELKRPEGWSDEKWEEHLVNVENWTGFDGLSAEEVSEVLIEADQGE